MKKKMGLSLAAVALAGSLFSSASLAKENNGKAYGKFDLVGLGDSISFGYNLGANNNQPSIYAFPYLIGEEADLKVRDLGIPGWTTTDLLNTLKSDPYFRQSIKHSRIITLDIGSNDLLQTIKASNGDPRTLQPLVSLMVPSLTDHLNQIIQEISSLTNAPIVVYNIYNPFQVNDPMHSLSNQLLTNMINPAIRQVVLSHKGTKLADAYSAFGENQATYVRQGDIHPTIDGQEVLAKIGEEALGID